MDSHPSSSPNSLTQSLHTITSIRQAVKKQDHVNVDLDGQYWINIDKNEILRHDLFKGKQLTPEQKAELEEVAVDNKLFDKVINFISLRPRSVKEVSDYLIYRRKLEPAKAQSLLTDLESRGFISDKQFTQWYVRNRLETGVHGLNKVKAELAQKGVAKSMVDTVLREYTAAGSFSDENLNKIRKYIQKIGPKIKAKDDFDYRRKLTARLVSRGFSFDEIKRAQQSD